MEVRSPVFNPLSSPVDGTGPSHMRCASDHPLALRREPEPPAAWVLGVGEILGAQANNSHGIRP